MKKNITILLGLGALLSFNQLNAQSFKEKLKAKMAAAKKELGSEKAPSLTDEELKNKEWVSIGENAKKWEDGEYNYWYVDRQGNKKREADSYFKFTKNSSGDVIKIGSRKSFGGFTPNGTEGVKFFVAYTGDGGYLYINETTIATYSFFEDGSIKIKRMYGQKANIRVLAKEIAAYRAYAGTKASGENTDHKEKLEEERKAKIAARLAKYGLKDKEVKSIKIVNIRGGKNGKIGCYSTVSFDIEATLTNGTVISTANQGFKSDYVITYNDVKLESGKIKAEIYKKDVFSVDVKVKNSPSIKAHKEIVIPYNQAITFNWSGTSWSRSRGENGKNIRIELMQIKHSETGKDLLKVRILKSDGSLLSKFKISPDMNIIVYVRGGNGGTDEGGVSPGGNGGTVTVIKDPSVKYYSLEAKVEGGRGGVNRVGRTAPSGRDGKIIKETRPVKF